MTFKDLTRIYTAHKSIGKLIQQATWRLVKNHKHDLGPGAHEKARDVIDTLYPSIMGEMIKNVKLFEKEGNLKALQDLWIQSVQVLGYKDVVRNLLKVPNAAIFEPDLIVLTKNLNKYWGDLMDAKETIEQLYSTEMKRSAAAVMRSGNVKVMARFLGFYANTAAKTSSY